MRAVPRSPWSRLRRVPAPLLVLLACGAVLSLSWNLAVAPLQGFDEADHVAYVARLAEKGKPPKAASGSQAVGLDEETALGPLGLQRLQQNLEARAPSQATAVQAFEAAEARLPEGAAGAGEGPNGQAKNPPLYYALEAIGWRLTPGGGFFTRLFVLRALTGVMFLAAIAFTWLAAGELFRRTVPRVAMTGVVALQPVAGYMSGIVNTDALQLAGWAAFLWLALRAVRLGPSPARVAWPALAAGAVVLTQGRGVAVVPAFLVALAVVLLRHRPPLRRLLVSGAVGVAIVAVTFVIYRLWVGAAGGGSLYGGEVNFGPASAFSLRQFLGFVWQFYLPPLESMAPRLGPAYGFRQVWVETFFGSFAQYEVTLLPWMYTCVQLGLGALLVASAAVVVRGWELLVARWAQVLVLGAIAVSVLGLLHLASYRALLGGGNDPLFTGRYLLPLLPLLGVCLGAVVAMLPRRLGPVVAVVTLVLLACLSLAGIGLTVARFYV